MIPKAGVGSGHCFWNHTITKLPCLLRNLRICEKLGLGELSHGPHQGGLNEPQGHGRCPSPAGQLHVRTRSRRGFHGRRDHRATPEQTGPCSEASHSSCQLINLLFTEFSLLFPAGTLDRVFHIFIAKKKKKINTTLGKPRHSMEKQILLPFSG